MTDLPPGWEWTTLGEVLEKIEAGRSFGARGRPARFGAWGIIRVSSMTYGSFRAEENKELAPGVQPRLEHRIRTGDILVSRANTVDYVGSAVRVIKDPGKLLLSDKSLRIVPNASIAPEFLMAFLESEAYRRQVELVATGTKDSMRNISQNELKKIRIALPPLAEQERIIARLEFLSSGVRLGQAALDAAAGKASIALRKCADDLIGRECAEEVPVKDILAQALSNGRSVPTREGGFPVLRLSALTQDGVNLSEQKDGDWSLESARPFLVQEGDFLISRGNGSVRLVGRGAFVRAVRCPVAFPDTMIRARIRKDHVDADFFGLVWHSTLIRQQIESCARTTAGIYKISQSDIRSVLIPLPRLERQVAIAAEFNRLASSVTTASNAIGSALDRAGRLKSTILSEALSGRLTTQDPNDEPASFLLHRVLIEREAGTVGARRHRGTAKAGF